LFTVADGSFGAVDRAQLRVLRRSIPGDGEQDRTSVPVSLQCRIGQRARRCEFFVATRILVDLLVSRRTGADFVAPRVSGVSG
jgi:hypothetical protein